MASKGRRSYLVPGLFVVTVASAVAWYFTGPGEDTISGIVDGATREVRRRRRAPPPPGWVRPPPIGSDPDYAGPDPSMPYRDSPYAQPTSDRVLRRAPVEDPDDTELLEAVTEAVEAAPGKIAYLSDGERDPRWRNLDARLVVVDPSELPDLEIAANARRLQERGADFVLVDTRTPPPGPWLQPRQSGLRERLRDALPTDFFHPVVRGEAWTLYRIAPPLRITREEQRRILAFVRRRLGGEAQVGMEGEGGGLDIVKQKGSLGSKSFRVAIALRKRGEKRLKGRPIFFRSRSGGTLERALAAATEAVRRDWASASRGAERGFGIDLAARLDDEIGNLEINVDVFDEICRITDRRPSRLLWNFELALEGLYLQKADTYHYRLPHEALHRGFESEAAFVERLEKTARLESGAWRDRDWKFGRFRTVSFIETRPGGEPVELYRGIPLVRVSQLSKRSVIRSLRVGSLWLTRNQLRDGQFRYRYKPLNKPGRRWLEGNNVVRHALNPYTLMLVNRVAPSDHLVRSAVKGLGYTMRHLKRVGRRCFVWHRDLPAPDENAKMGTVAVTILSILKMGEATDISEWEDELRCLAEEIIYMQDRNGHFRQYDVPEDHDYYGAENAIFPGELMFALARMYDHTGNERYHRAYDRAVTWYQAWWADRVSKRTDDGIYTERLRMDLVGFVPWANMSLEQMHRKTDDDVYARWAEELQDWMDEMFLWDEHRTPYPDYLGAYFKTHGELPAINSCGYTEGAAAVYAIALRTGRNLERRRRALMFGLRFAMQLQYEGDATVFWVPDPEVAMGGYRYHLGASRLRNDYSYHAMSALGHAVAYIPDDHWPARRPIDLPEALAEAQ